MRAAMIGCALMGLFLVGASCGVPLSEGSLYRYVRGQTTMLLNPDNTDSGGTGFVVITPNGNRFTLTNAHVCRGTERSWMVARPSDGSEPMNLSIIMVASDIDLCLLDPLPDHEGLPLAAESNILDFIYVVGHPRLLPAILTKGYYISRSVEQISDPDTAERDCIGPNRSWEIHMTLFGPVGVCAIAEDSGLTDASIRPGNSGSPVTNVYGELVGVAFAADETIGLFLPLDRVRAFLSSF
jgi:S1-C subfamily serine protease